MNNQILIKELVKNINGKATTTSLEVAQVFEKDHAQVLKNIEKLIKTGDRVFFDLISYKDSYGRDQKAYRLDRDAFSLVAMGFTGRKAYNFKVDFIEAFNEMEAQLKDPKQISLRESLTLNLELLDKAERLEKENKHQQKVIEDQNKLHGSIIKLKATETRTALKALKDDLGAEINRCVFQLFGNINDPRQKHVSAHELYQRMTGKVYLGAKNSSYESKCDYLDFLKTQINRLGTEK